MFRDRRDAGRALARLLSEYRDRPDGVVLAIPRGGVAVAAVVADELGLPLDVVLAKKIGHPLSPEYAIGFVSLTGQAIDREVVERDRIPWDYVEAEAAAIRRKLEERRRLYQGDRAAVPLEGRTVLLVDDGVATGSTMEAAIETVRRESPARIVAAVPVGPPGAVAGLAALADEVACVLRPDDFSAIGAYYGRFDPVEDEDAVRLLRERSAGRARR